MAQHFVPVKVDAEKGQGPELSKRYSVRGFPTMLVVDAQGEEVDRFVGFRPPESLLAVLRGVVAGESFRALKLRVAEHPSDFEAALKLGRKYEERGDYGAAEELYRRLLEDPAVPAPARTGARGRMVIVEYVQSRGRKIAPVEAFFREARDSEGAVDHARVLFARYQREERTEELIPPAEYLFGHGFAEDPTFLNNYAWYLATHDTRLERALELAKKAVELRPEAAHIADTLAEAYHRNGRHEEAVRTQRHAVELAGDEERQEFQKRLEGFERALKAGRRRIREF